MRLAVALVAALVAAPAVGAQSFGGSFSGGRTCGTAEPTFAQALEAQRVVERFRSSELRLAAGPLEPITVPVVFHVVRAGQTVALGDVPDAWIEAQMDTLNAAFEPLGLRLALAHVNRVDNADWYEGPLECPDRSSDCPGETLVRFGLELGDETEREMKDALAVDPARVLNIYTASLGSDYLGWATLPASRQENDVYQGVVLLDQSLPGGDAAPYNLGHTGTHEVGHWAGLQHTFAGGCSEPGDGVADTPQQREATSGCPAVAPDSCPADPGRDPIHNFMDYSYDACMTGFTDGQTSRVRALLTQFRPTVVSGDYSVVSLPEDALRGLFVGVETVAPLRVTNASREPLTVTGATSAAAAVALAPTVVQPSEAALIELSVIPQRAGAVGVEVLIDGSPAAIALGTSGVAQVPPTAALREASVRVQVIEGGGAIETVTLANDGGGPLSYDVDEGSLPEWVERVAPNSGVIAAGDQVVFAVSVSAEELTEGLQSGSFTVATNDPIRGDVEVPVELDVLLRPRALAVGPVFPNPGRGLIRVPIESPFDGPITVDVVDVRGRRVAVLAEGRETDAGYPTLRWDASDVAPGVYLVRVRSDYAVAATRVVVAR